MDNEQIKQEIEKLIELKSKLTDDLKDIETNINDMIQRLKSKIKPVNVWEKYGIKQFPTNTKESFFKYPTREQAEKVSKLCFLFRKALHIMEQLNDGYEWIYDGNNYIPVYNYRVDKFQIHCYSISQRSIFYLSTEEKAKAFLEIMGEKDLKTLMGIKG